MKVMLRFIMPYVKILVMSIAPIIIFVYIRNEVRDRKFDKAMIEIEKETPNDGTYNTRASVNYDSVVIYYRNAKRILNDSI